jgi:hypothetical protein
MEVDLITKVKLHVEIYLFAKAIKIDRSKIAAQNRVASLVRDIFARPRALTGLADVLATIYKSTKAGERGLREALSTICLEKYEACCKNAAVNAVLEEHESTLWRVAVLRVRRMETAKFGTASLPSQTSTPSFFPAGKAKQSSSSLFGGLRPGLTSSVPPQSTPLAAKPGPVALTPKPRPPSIAKSEQELNGEQLIYHSICMMAEYANYYFEELRTEDYGYVLPNPTPTPTPVEEQFGSQKLKANGNPFGTATRGIFSFGNSAHGLFGRSSGGPANSQSASGGGVLSDSSAGSFVAGLTDTRKSLGALGPIPRPIQVPFAAFGNKTPGQDKSPLSSAPDSVSSPSVGFVAQSPVTPDVATRLQSADTAFPPWPEACLEVSLSKPRD